MKSLHSNNVLVHKGVLLNAIVNMDASNDIFVGVKRFS
jgi:hypothetical protein